jgi:hypothetical protein
MGSNFRGDGSKTMVASGRVKAVGTLAALGLVTSITASLIVSICVTNTLIAFGVILILASVALLVIAFVRDQEETKLRSIYVMSGLFGLIGGITMCCETRHLREVSNQLTLIVIYAITAVAISTMLSFAYHFVTGLAIRSELDLVKVSVADESLIYFALNLLSGFLIGVTVAVSNPRNKINGFDGTGLAYSIGIWFLNAILLGVVGFVWTKDGLEISKRYESAEVPFATGSTYTDFA